MSDARITFTGDLTLWIVAADAYSTSFAVYRGQRTASALRARLAREARPGRTARLQIETNSCSPVDFSLEELIAVGIVADDEGCLPRTGADRLRDVLGRLREIGADFRGSRRGVL
jgi:hypothetical protein